MEKHTFYYEASCRICGSLQIEKALFSCFLYIQDFIPADTLTLHLFDPGLGFIETVADASLKGGTVLSSRTQLLPAIREHIRAFIGNLEGKPGCHIIDRLSSDETAGPVATPNRYAYVFSTQMRSALHTIL